MLAPMHYKYNVFSARELPGTIIKMKSEETAAELNLGARSALRRAKRGRRRKAAGTVRRPRDSRGPPTKARMQLNEKRRNTLIESHCVLSSVV